MTHVDIAVLSFIGMSVFFNFVKGFISCLLDLCGFATAVFLTNYTFPYIKSYLAHFAKITVIVYPIGYAVLFIAFIVIFWIIAGILKIFFFRPRISVLNHVLGGILGFVKALLWVSVVLMIITIASGFIKGSCANIRNTPEFIRKSITYSILSESQKYLLSKMNLDKILSCRESHKKQVLQNQRGSSDSNMSSGINFNTYNNLGNQIVKKLLDAGNMTMTTNQLNNVIKLPVDFNSSNILNIISGYSNVIQGDVLSSLKLIEKQTQNLPLGK